MWSTFISKAWKHLAANQKPREKWEMAQQQQWCLTIWESPWKLFLLEFKVNENVTKCHLTAGMMMPVNIDVPTLLPSMVFTTFYILIKKTSPSLLSPPPPPNRSDSKSGRHPAEELFSQRRAHGSQETLPLRHDQTLQQQPREPTVSSSPLPEHVV